LFAVTSSPPVRSSYLITTGVKVLLHSPLV
jgi:hypothetical protein